MNKVLKELKQIFALYKDCKTRPYLENTTIIRIIYFQYHFSWYLSAKRYYEDCIKEISNKKVFARNNNLMDLS